MCREVERAYRFVETDSEAAEEALAVEAGDDALPERGGAFLAGDGGHGAEHALVLGSHMGVAGKRFPLQLQPHLRCIQRNRTCLPPISSSSACCINPQAHTRISKLRTLLFKSPNSITTQNPQTQDR
jgi:hypothetical protein